MRYLFLFLVAVVVAPQSEESRSEGQESSRTLEFRQGLRIAQQLQAGDRRVTVVNPNTPLSGRPATEGSIEDFFTTLTVNSTAVLIGSVSSATPRLTADEDWILTDYEFAESQRLKGQTEGTSGNRGALSRWTRDGGTLVIDGVSVTASAEWSVRFERGSSYLIFASRGQNQAETPWWLYKVSETSTLESADGMFHSRHWADPGHGVSLATAKRFIERSARKP